MGNQLQIDFTDLPNKSVETFSQMLMTEYDYIAAMRISYFYSSKPRPGQFTVLVRSIPVIAGRSIISESMESFFSEYYPSNYLSYSVVHRSGKLQGLMNKVNKVYKKLVCLNE
ncbi:hypothetical protein OROHE_006728 [Orobanche hederae]